MPYRITHRNIFDYAQSLFIFLVCCTVWFPFSFDIGGLNIRASQLLLPFVILLLAAKHPRLSPRAVLIITAGVVWWSSTFFWTLVGRSNPNGHPMGRILLIGMNLLHLGVMYLLLRKTRNVALASSVFLATVALLNGVLLVITVGVAFGMPIPSQMMRFEEAPLLEGGDVVSAEVLRFTFGGVSSGCVSAAAVLLGICYYLNPSGVRPKGLILYLLFGVIGMFLGFSRQALLSLILGLAAGLSYQAIRGGGMKVLKMAALVTIVTFVGIELLNWSPAGHDYFAAFTGRIAELTTPNAYTTGTIGGRTEIWTGMWQDISRNPLVGNGQDAYMKYVRNYGEEGSHNFPLEVLHASGIVGFGAWVILHLVIGVAAFRQLRRVDLAEFQRNTLLGFSCGGIAIVSASFSNLIFWNPTYWMFLGMLLGASELCLQTGSKPVPGAIANLLVKDYATQLR